MLRFMEIALKRKFITGGIVLFTISMFLIFYLSLNGMLKGYIIITCTDLITTLALSLVVFTSDYSDFYKILGRPPDRSAFFGFSLFGSFILAVSPVLIIGFVGEVAHDRGHALVEVYRYIISTFYTLALMWICSELSKDAMKRINPKPPFQPNGEDIVTWINTLDN